jgi:hypothetical protein
VGADGELVIVDFSCTVLGRTVSASGFDIVVEFPQKEVLKIGAAGKCATLVGTDTPSLHMAMLSEKFFDNVKRGRLRVSEENPNVAQSFIDYEEVSQEAIV